MGIEPGSRWKRKQHDGTSPSRDFADPSSVVSRRINVAFHPMRECVLVTVITTNLAGHDRWDRKDGTFTLDIPIHELAGLPLQETLSRLLSAALLALD